MTSLDTYLKLTLAERFAASLPDKQTFKFYHLSTPPTRSPALYAAPPGQKAEKTYTESHFLNVSIPHDGSEVLVLAIEVLIYTTRHLTTIFVSKADSTGYLSVAGLAKGHASPLRTIATTFLEFLVEKRQRKGRKLVLSLFARASDQYLFPGSVSNPSKHISDDRQLVKWWCRVLDPVLQKFPGAASGVRPADREVTAQAYLVVPGEDSIAPYLPQHVRLDPKLRDRWKHGHPLRELANDPSLPPRSLVPHFPDDPKARFLDELDDELPDGNNQAEQSPSKRGNGQWKSVRSLEQFWEMMAFRQECCSGRLVGFLWVVFTPAEEGSESQQQESQESTGTEREGTPTPMSAKKAARTPARTPARGSKILVKKRKKVLRGPIVPRTPRIKKSSTSTSTAKDIPIETPHYVWSEDSRGNPVLSEKHYKKATERLLQLQFKNLESAVASTKAWIEEVGVLAGKKSLTWGFEVVGRKEAETVEEGRTCTNGASPRMMMVKKKKRKAQDEVDDGLEKNQESGVVKINDVVNTLGAGLVKKKKKVQPVQITS